MGAIRQLLTVLLAGFIAASSEAAGTENVQAHLVSNVDTIQPGSSFWIGVRLEHQPHWHTYWENPAESGIPTTIAWTLPDGLLAGEIVWPLPKVFSSQGISGIGYEGKTTLLVPMKTDVGLPVGQAVELKAKVAWLECDPRMCVPGDADLSLTLPVASTTPDSAHVEEFKEAHAASIVPVDNWQVAPYIRDHALWLDVTVGPEDQVADGKISFLPIHNGMIDYLGNQLVTPKERGFTLQVPLSKTDVIWPDDRLDGVFIHERGWDASGVRQGRSISVPFDKEAATPSTIVASKPPTSTKGLGGALGAAFLGGLILNLMPCVFPVISLKILGFVKQAESSPAHVWHHGLAFAFGVLVSFWVLAGTLLALKSAGEAIGWGFQLQSPAFVVGMAVLFVLIAMNLFGVFEVGTSLTGVGQEAAAKEGYAGSFFSGVLATIVATPCTAPFMAGALGVALTQPAWAAMTIFTFLGLGMATPYLILSRFPDWLKKVPRPGPWMETMKQGMGFMMLAFALYLVWVYAGQRGDDGLSRLLTGLLVVGTGGWVLGRWSGLEKSNRVRWGARLAAMVLVVAGIAIGISVPKAYGWVDYEPAKVDALVEAGEPVFVDFTAKWCLSCQANKKAALNRAEVQKRFKELGVTIMQADWTDQNETIARVLESFGRSGVPLYVLYTGKQGVEPVLLPELLTPSIVLNALEEHL